MSATIRKGYVSNEGLRREFVRRRELGWLTASDVAFRMGWAAHNGCPDTSRVERKLGLTVAYRHGGRGCRQRTVRAGLAAELAEAIGCDPHEVGL